MNAAEKLSIDLKELEDAKQRNREERLKFIDWWVEYMKSHADKEWGEGQNNVIDCQINDNSSKS